VPALHTIKTGADTSNIFMQHRYRIWDGSVLGALHPTVGTVGSSSCQDPICFAVLHLL